MKGYIDRAAALKYLQSRKTHFVDNVGKGWDAGIGAAIEAIEALPAADVAEVRHGRWLLEREPDGTPYCFHCSVCDDDYHYIGIKSATDYCPNCGARMED